MATMEHIRSKMKESGSEGLSSGRLASAHFLARLASDLAILSFHFGGRCHDEKTGHCVDVRFRHLSVHFPGNSHVLAAFFSIMGGRRNET